MKSLIDLVNGHRNRRLIGWGVLMLFSLNLDATESTFESKMVDPFLKKDLTPIDPTADLRCNYTLTLMVYRLSQKDGFDLLTSSRSDLDRYDHILDLQNHQQARLDTVLSIAGKIRPNPAPPERETLEQVNLFSFRPPLAPLINESLPRMTSPSTIRTSTGYMLNFLTTHSEDPQALKFEFDMRSMTLDGWRQSVTDATDTCLPQLNQQALTFKAAQWPTARIQFFGTLNSPPKPAAHPNTNPLDTSATPPEIRLLFGRIDREAPGTTAQMQGGDMTFLHQLSIFSLDRTTAVQILTQTPGMDSVYAAIQSLVKSNQAVLEKAATLSSALRVTTSSDDTPTSSLNDQGGQTEKKPVSAETNPPSLHMLIDLTPTDLDELYNNTVDLSVGITLKQNLGKIPPEDGADNPNAGPVWQQRSIHTKLIMGIGEHTFLGTLNPPSNSGIDKSSDDSRIWLAFIHTVLVNR